MQKKEGEQALVCLFVLPAKATSVKLVYMFKTWFKLVALL
jgi:hypothetical protein